MTPQRFRIRPLPTALMAAILPIVGFATLHAEPPSESQLKVAYLYNFTKFVTWPASAFAHDREAFQLCVLGEESLGPILNALRKKNVGTHPITIRHPESPRTLPGCHLLFIPRSEEARLSEMFAVIRDQPILTVGESPDFADQGGMIHFIRIHDTLRFAINQETALHAGLKIHATLLQVGHVLK